MFIKKFVKRLEEYLRKQFPAVNVSLYVNRKCKFVHMGMDYPLMSRQVPHELISSIQDFKRQNLDESFRFLIPKLIHTTHWKYDYIIIPKLIHTTH